MLTCFTKITNSFSSLGDAIDNDQKIKKVIRALHKSWEVKASSLIELNDRKRMDFSGFIKNIKTHEMKMEVREEKEPLKKKATAFRVTPSIPEDDSMDKKEEDEFTMLVWKVSKMFYKKERMSNFRRSRMQKKK